MASPALRISIHFLQPYSHGRGGDGLPEWPPSPLRMFQALVASSVGRQPDHARRRRAIDALRWLEAQAAPEIVAAPAAPTRVPYRLFVPDNVGDRVARGWSAGRDADLAGYRTEKDVREMRLAGETVHYVFANAIGFEAHLADLRTAARSMTHLGWGIDMVAGDAGELAEQLEGERWIAGRHGGPSLRRPIAGTFDALERRHEQFLARIEGGTFRPVDPLSVFAVEPYARPGDISPWPFAGFRLLQPITGDRLSLDPARRARDVAAWVRHAAAEVCESWPFQPTRSFVHGHRSEDGEASSPRFSFLPLPTINPRLGRVEAIARVLVAAPPGCERQVEWVRTRLGGQELMWDDEPIAILEPLPRSDWVLRQYVGSSDTWSTVTPVVLPGHDDGSERKAERLLRKAFLQAGMNPEVVEGIQRLTFRKVPFRAGAEITARYRAPEKVQGPMFHVRVRFKSMVTGPLAIGSGRHRGIGVFAIE